MHNFTRGGANQGTFLRFIRIEENSEKVMTTGGPSSVDKFHKMLLSQVSHANEGNIGVSPVRSSDVTDMSLRKLLTNAIAPSTPTPQSDGQT